MIVQLVFVPLAARGATKAVPHPWLNHVMQILALFMLCGLATSLLIPEMKRRSLEGIAGESESTLKYELNFLGDFFGAKKEENRNGKKRHSRFQ